MKVIILYSGPCSQISRDFLASVLPFISLCNQTGLGKVFSERNLGNFAGADKTHSVLALNDRDIYSKVLGLGQPFPTAIKC